MKKTGLVFLLAFVLVCVFTSCSSDSRQCNCQCCNCCKEDSVAEFSKETIGDFASAENEEKEVFYEDVLSIEPIDLGEKEEVYDTAKELYINGEWDGIKTIFIEGKEVKFSKHGYILIDEEMVKSEDLFLPEDLDLTSLNSNIRYIPNKGDLAIIGHSLVVFRRKGQMEVIGNLDEVEGLDIDLKTVDVENLYPPENEFQYTPTPYLYYDEETQKILIVTPNESQNFGYLYILDSFDNAENMMFGGIITNYWVEYDGKRNHFYVEMEDKILEFTKNGFIPSEFNLKS